MLNARRSRGKRIILDIGSSAIRLCELTQTKTGYQLTKYFQREVLNDPSVDAETRTQQRQDTLKKLLKDAKVRGNKVVIAVPGRSVFTRARTLPPVPEHKVTQIVRYEIQQQIPFSLDQIALDYQILNRSESGSYDVMMAAIKVDVVDKQLEALKGTKLSVDTVDVCPLAAYNWLKHAGEFGTDGECVALLDMGASTTDIVIERGGQFRFTRPLSIGGDDITRALSENFGASFPEAENFKRQRGFAPTGDAARDGKVGEVIGKILTRLVTEVSRSFGYYRSLPGGGTIDRVVVTGGGACLRNIVPYLQRELGVDVRIARPLAGLAIGPSAQEANEHPERACVALGMALRRCEPAAVEINLIPPQVLEASRRKEQVLLWILSFVTLALIVASVIPRRANSDRLVLKEIDELKKLISLYDPAVAADPSKSSPLQTVLNEEKKKVESYKANLDELAKMYDGAQFWLDDLLLLNSLRPDGNKVWFSSLETSVIAPDKGGKPAGGSGIMGAAAMGSSGGPAPGISSTGFPGLSLTGAAATGLAGFGSIGGGPGPEAAAKTPEAKPPAKPNGYSILGYAEDPDALNVFINNLRGCERFKAGVYFDEACVRKVSVDSLNEAKTATSRGSSSGGGGGGMTGGMTGGMMGGGPTNEREIIGKWVVFFRVDIQFEQSQAAAAATPASAPGATGGASNPWAQLGQKVTEPGEGADK